VSGRILVHAGLGGNQTRGSGGSEELRSQAGYL
jgi:hypothetical protein